MNNKNLLAILPILAFSGISQAQTCYTVEGKVDTINTSQFTQKGTIELVLLDESGNEAFRKSGDLDGVITGGTLYGPTLSHMAKFEEDDAFTTNDDQAIFLGVRAFDDGGQPCSFYIREKMSSIVAGSGFFQNVTDIDVTAEGYTSFCFAEGSPIPVENENEFELAGNICVE